LPLGTVQEVADILVDYPRTAVVAGTGLDRSRGLQPGLSGARRASGRARRVRRNLAAPAPLARVCRSRATLGRGRHQPRRDPAESEGEVGPAGAVPNRRAEWNSTRSAQCEALARGGRAAVSPSPQSRESDHHDGQDEQQVNEAAHGVQLTTTATR
jgi:hypothetical protein